MNLNSEQPAPDNQPDLDWLAFCYIAGELSDEQRGQFESRLEHDLDAQQAVVDAMTQSQLIDAAVRASLNEASPSRESTTPILPVDPTSPSHGRIPRFLFAAAASLMLIVVGWGWYTHQPMGGSTAEISVDEESLADAWANTDTNISEVDWDDAFDDDPFENAPDDGESGDWMYVALTDLESSMEGAE